MASIWSSAAWASGTVMAARQARTWLQSHFSRRVGSLQTQCLARTRPSGVHGPQFFGVGRAEERDDGHADRRGHVHRRGIDAEIAVATRRKARRSGRAKDCRRRKAAWCGRGATISRARSRSAVDRAGGHDHARAAFGLQPVDHLGHRARCPSISTASARPDGRGRCAPGASGASSCRAQARRSSGTTRQRFPGFGRAQLQAGVVQQDEMLFHFVHDLGRRRIDGKIIGATARIEFAPRIMGHAEPIARAAEKRVPRRAVAFGEADGQVEAALPQFADEIGARSEQTALAR